VFTLRCTRALLKRLKLRPDLSPAQTTTQLGDWYANLLHHRRQQLILCVSEKSLLHVLLPAKGTESARVRLVAGVGGMLRAIGIPESVVQAEISAMAEAALSITASRSVLGSMTDFALMLETYLSHGDTLIAAALRLAEAPCSPIAMASPKDATRELLRG
jgi:hypothetical protein